jgi:hypothetical protein
MKRAKIMGTSESCKTSGSARTPPPIVEVSKAKLATPVGSGTSPKIMPTAAVRRIPTIKPP